MSNRRTARVDLGNETIHSTHELWAAEQSPIAQVGQLLLNCSIAVCVSMVMTILVVAAKLACQ
jgi:hypothetical protein